MNNAVIVGVDIGGTKIRIGTVNSNAELTDEKILSSREMQGDGAVEGLLCILKSFITSLQLPVMAVAIGFPSTLNKERDTLITTPNLKGFNNVPIKKLYEEALNIPVFIGKDATMLLYYDLHNLKISHDTGVVAGIYIGTGIGNSIIIDGNEFKGSSGIACELGHIPIPGRNDPCGCGLKGCIELYAGGKGLETICKNEFPQTPIGEAFVKHGDTEPMRQFVAEIADAVAIEINIINPGYVVLGGGVLQMQAFPKDLLRQLISDKTITPVPGDTIKIMFSEDGNPYTGVVGSALYAAKQLKGGELV